MYKLFSITQANRLLPQVKAKLAQMQRTASDLTALQASLEGTDAIAALNARQEAYFLHSLLEEQAREMHALGAHIKDLEQGKIVFPSQVGAEVVALCWQQGEDAIRYYQRMDQEEKYALPSATNVAVSEPTSESMPPLA